MIQEWTIIRTNIISIDNLTLKITDQNVRSRPWCFKEGTSTSFDDNLFYYEHPAFMSRFFSEGNTSDWHQCLKGSVTMSTAYTEHIRLNQVARCKCWRATHTLPSSLICMRLIRPLPLDGQPPRHFASALIMTLPKSTLSATWPVYSSLGLLQQRHPCEC